MVSIFIFLAFVDLQKMHWIQLICSSIWWCMDHNFLPLCWVYIKIVLYPTSFAIFGKFLKDDPYSLECEAAAFHFKLYVSVKESRKEKKSSNIYKLASALN